MNSRLWSFRRLAGAFALVLSSLLVGQGVALGQTRLSLTDLLAQIDAANAAIVQLQTQVNAQSAVIAQLQGLNQALEAKVFCISPNSTSTEPSAWRVKPRLMIVVRNSSGALPLGLIWPSCRYSCEAVACRR